MKPTHLDLFSGIGGFAIAFQRAGFETVGFCEKDEYAQKILVKQFGAIVEDSKCDRRQSWRPKQSRQQRGIASDSPSPRLHPDIFTLNGADYAGVDVVTGGFPCQSFSTAGKRRGKADDRAIWPQMLRIITEARPTWVLAENVAGISSMVEFCCQPPMECNGGAKGEEGNFFNRDGQGYLYEILESLKSIGYDVQPFTVPACAVDAKHRRSRIWIVAFSESTGTMRKPGNICEENGGQNYELSRQLNGTSYVAAAKQQSGHRWSDGIGWWSREPLETLQTLGENRGKENGLSIPQSKLGRVADGIPHRAHRLRCLGNAIVPAVAEVFARAIYQQIIL